MAKPRDSCSALPQAALAREGRQMHLEIPTYVALELSRHRTPTARTYVEAVPVEGVGTAPLACFEEGDWTLLCALVSQLRLRESTAVMRGGQKAASERRSSRERPDPVWSHTEAVERCREGRPSVSDLKVMERLCRSGVTLDDLSYLFGVSCRTAALYVNHYRTACALQGRPQLISRREDEDDEESESDGTFPGSAAGG